MIAHLRHRSRAIRAVAWGAVAAGVLAPLARRRVRLPKPVVTVATIAAPVALGVVRPRSRERDVVICMLQMWAYVAHYEMPNDDPEALEARVRIDYPVRIDRVLGAGELPGVRLQRLLADGGRVRGWLRARDAHRALRVARRLEIALCWSHWVWFAVPHAALAFVMVRRPEQFERSALMLYATFDLGVLTYWVLPTAPPWYAASVGRAPAMRRLMVERGAEVWGDRWDPLYGSLGGNPLAAMPSLHFATSVMAARLLADVGRVPGALGAGYAGVLGFALVYLGEHYVADLLAAAGLAVAVRRLGPRATPLLALASRGLQGLQRTALA